MQLQQAGQPKVLPGITIIPVRLPSPEADQHAGGDAINGVVSTARVDTKAKQDSGANIPSSEGAKGPEPTVKVTYHEQTEFDNLDRFLAQHGQDLLWVPAQRDWRVWDGTHWVKAEGTALNAHALAEQTIRSIRREAEVCADKRRRLSLLKWVRNSETAAMVDAIVKGASRRLAVLPDTFDRHDHLLNLANGTYDLATNTFREHRREDRLSRIIPINYDPTAQAPRYKQFVSEIMGGRKEMAEYLMRIAGYSLSADVNEKCFFVFYGDGNNGKSKWIDVHLAILGGYGEPTNFETFLAKPGSASVPYDVANFIGKRSVVAVEAPEHQVFSGALLKACTGGDTFKVRQIYGKPATLVPKMKIILGTNALPSMNGADKAMVQRVKLLHFGERFVENPREGERQIDRNLMPQLHAELPGILNAYLAGWKDYQRQGMAHPQEVLDATQEYAADNDPVEMFLATMCNLYPKNTSKRETLRELYEAYARWAYDNAKFEMTLKQFNSVMESKGYKKYKSGTWLWLGVRLAAKDGPSPPICQQARIEVEARRGMPD